MTDHVFSDRVTIRRRYSDIAGYVPPKGIDIVFNQIDDNQKQSESHLFDTTVVGSDLNPDTPISQHQLNEVLSGWKSIVSDRVRTQNKKPLKHRIETNISRPKKSFTPEVQEAIEKLRADQIHKDKDGNKIGRILDNEEINP